MKTMIERIRDLREDNDLKQLDVANLLGTTQQQYSRYETGETELSLRALMVRSFWMTSSAAGFFVSDISGAIRSKSASVAERVDAWNVQSSSISVGANSISDSSLPEKWFKKRLVGL